MQYGWSKHETEQSLAGDYYDTRSSDFSRGLQRDPGPYYIE